MGALTIPKLSVEEYLTLDRAAELKNEYHDGELFPMVAVSIRHGAIAAKLASAIDARLPERCQALLSVRVRVAARQFVYPDLMVICGKPALTDEQQDTVTNPKVILEILSPSTADYDAGGKFRLYRELPSFEEYVLISQDVQLAEVFHKAPDGSWILRAISGEGAMVKLHSLAVEFPLAALYEGLDVPLKSPASEN